MTTAAKGTPLSPQALAVKRVKSALLKKESRLITTKAFRYRHMPATVATEEFFREYLSTYRRYWRSNQDYREADAQEPFGGLAFPDLPEGEFTSLWIGRQGADAIGATYSFYVTEAFEFVVQTLSYRRFPRPNQLYEDRVIEHVRERWRQYAAASEFITSMPELRSDHSFDNFIRSDHYKFLMQELASRTGFRRTLAIANACFHHRVLPVALVEAKFGSVEVERAKREVFESQIVPVIPLTEPPVPSCWGIPAAMDLSLDSCSRCELTAACRAAADMAKVEASSAGETKDDRTRRMSRERQRKRRARKAVAE